VVDGSVPPTEAVRIFVKFFSSVAAHKALTDLNGRYFGGRVVNATLFDEERFENKDFAPRVNE